VIIFYNITKGGLFMGALWFDNFYRHLIRDTIMQCKGFKM